MERLSEREISSQESLTLDRLNKLSTRYYKTSNRPTDSLIELVQWAKEFVIPDEEKDHWEIFIHNKISIDGSFIKFCEDSGALVKSLHTDAITSWQSDYEHEHFVAAGIFEITKQVEKQSNDEDLKFYHCGLFHKGNQNEDEVSFFVIVKKDRYEDYIKFRNLFVEWQTKRERESLEIEVVGGNPIPYTLDVKWEDLYLPDELRTGIVNKIQGFLNSKETYERLKVPWRMGLGFWGPRGCGKTTCLRVIMSEWPQLKPVTVQPGHSSIDEMLEDAYEYAEEHSPSVLILEDLQEMLKTIDMSHFLQLLDGLQKRDGIITIVTGNDFSDLEENLKSRPRRFDRLFEFPLPDIEQTKRYLSDKFEGILDTKKVESIAKKTVKNKFTYSHLQEIYFNAVFIAIPDGRDIPIVKDVDESLKQVISSKTAADEDFSSRKRDLTDDYEYEEDEDSVI